MNNFDWQKIKHRTHGQWRQILSSLAGLDDKQLSNKHQPCPACGGNDRYRFDDKEQMGGYICGQCGSGDGISLLEKCTSMNFFECVQEIGRYLNLEPDEQARTYAPPKPVNKIVSTRKNDYSSYQKSFSWLNDTRPSKMCVFAARNRISTPLNLDEDHSVLWRIERAHALVNCYRSSENNLVNDYAAGGMTNGGYHRINQDNGKSIFFCVNIIDSHLTAQFTNSECVCVFEHANLLDAIEQYIEDYKPQKPLYMAINDNQTELILAEQSGLKVIMPIDSKDIQTSSGFHKKLFNPSEVLDNG